MSKKFSSIEEIKSYFGIDNDTVEDIRKELRKRIKEFHPDTTNGEFKSIEQQERYDNLSNAIQFLDNEGLNNSNLILSKNELTSLIKRTINHEMSLFHGQTNNEEKIQKTENQLKAIVEESVVKFQKYHLFPKITSVVIVSIISLIWLFPETATKHPVLRELIDIHHIGFTAFWLFSLMLVGSFWFILTIHENRDKTIKTSYSLDSTQNRIFRLFIGSLYSKFKGVKHEGDRRAIIFEKDWLLNFLINDYESINRNIDINVDDDWFKLKEKIKIYYETNLHNKKGVHTSANFIVPFLKRPGLLEFDFLQQLTDTIIQKLLQKRVITPVDDSSISEKYKYYID